MSDDEDYMSDKFLEKSKDVCPSLIQNRAKKRQVKMETKRQDQIPKKKSRNELLQESLEKKISPENKGFQLLAKMGYKPGQALGKNVETDIENSKTNPLDHRLIEPIGISIKENRGGLGREAALLELQEKQRELRQQRIMQKLGGGEISTEEFRRRATAKAEERFILGALRGCQKTCENLDNAAKVELPEMSWFWPEREEKAEEESAENEEKDKKEELSIDDEVEYTPTEKLEMLLSYLRTAYVFCFWCGIKYNSLDDLNTNCPGLTRDDH